MTGCTTPLRHQILGTTYGWDVEAMNVQVLIDAEVGKLRVRHVRMRSINCQDGISEHLEISGAIGPDSTAAIERLLPKLAKCKTKEGGWLSNAVFMSSGGGFLKDGYKMGELFKQYEVQTVVVGGQVCASSCAIAFLGGKFRNIYHDGKLLFHAPYINSGIAIDCSDRGQVADLRSYYLNVLGGQDGEFLLNRTMSYCTATDGWTLNADGAKLFGITTN